MVIFKNKKKNARYFVPILFNVVCLERDFKSSFFFDTTDQRKNEQQLKQIGKEEKREELENYF